MGSKYLTDKITKPVTAYGFKGMSNLPEFAAAFAIDEASPMARGEETRARIW